MKISYNWLKEYIDFKESPEKIAEMLTASGSEVKAIGAVEGGDYLMDIEITPNRSDCLNYIGIAREVSALTGKKVKTPPLKMRSTVHGPRSTVETCFSVEIKDRALCPWYTARLIKNVTIKDSPDWLKKKIIIMGLRPVNNVVDVINFVLFETGQPMHAFDYDKIKGRKIIVRKASEGEKIISIDNAERKLEKDMLVIADEERPIAVAGVMGGLNTEVNSGTTNVLLESAYFDPVSIRRTAYKLALASESSYRFERGVDTGMVLATSDRAAALIQELCGGDIAELTNKGEKAAKSRKIMVSIERLNDILNLKLSEKYVESVLSALCLKSARAKKGFIKVEVPSFRQDINDPIDIIEETARIYGYEKIAKTIPCMVPNPERRPLSWQIKKTVISTLTLLGFNEIITYGMISKDALMKMKKLFPDLKAEIAVKNPLSVEQEYMRPFITPGILDVLNRNINRGIKNLNIFEVGSIYNKDYKYEMSSLCIALTDSRQRDNSQVVFYNLKGVIETLFSKLGLEPEKISIISENTGYSRIFYSSSDVGFVVVLGNRLKEEFGLEQKAFIAELYIDKLKINLDKTFSELPKYPSAKRDISLIKTKALSFDRIRAVIKEKGGDLVESISEISMYTGEQIPDGHQGLAFRIEYRNKTMTLTSEEVDRVHTEIRDSLVKKLGVALR